MSTTMASATVEPASAMKSTSTVEAAATVIPATVIPAAYEAVATASITTSGIVAATSVAVRISFMSVAPTPAGIAAAPTVVTPAAAIISAIPEVRRVSPVIPRARANEYAVHEVVRAVVAVWRAGIRIIVIVPIGADRRASRVSRTNSNPETHLRLRIR